MRQREGFGHHKRPVVARLLSLQISGTFANLLLLAIRLLLFFLE
jgi:hypothetical protein